ncbi:hypothetical protein [Gracilimonas sp. BCB1]|uniref:hypothetical protein n=1 Tax=Gracilimonas sp. BCB1 TaxID=3152362 RepID=UPI0032D92586
MKTEFNLTHISANKDPLTDRITFTETLEFRLWMTVAASCMISVYIFDMLDVDLAGWQQMLLAAGMVIGYGFAFMGILFRRSAGKAVISENEIKLHPTKKKDKYPDEPISVTESSEIKVYVVQKLNWFTPKAILQFTVTNNSQENEFTIKLGNKKTKEQYLELLEGWYRGGYSVEEYDISGSRIFKLDRGKSYADIQEIKSEYGISW